MPRGAAPGDGDGDQDRDELAGGAEVRGRQRGVAEVLVSTARRGDDIHV